jgi:hypothetical protein
LKGGRNGSKEEKLLSTLQKRQGWVYNVQAWLVFTGMEEDPEKVQGVDNGIPRGG